MTDQKTAYHFFLAGLLLLSASAACAATASVRFDFGTEPGKVTAADAGFALMVPPAGRFENSSGSLLLESGSGRFENFGFLQGFVGMRAADGYDFVITMHTSIRSTAGSNNRRWGIHLFGSENLDEEGLCALIIGNNADDNRLLVIRRGLNREDIASAVFAKDGFSKGEEYTFTLAGNYSGSSDLEVSLSVTDGLNTGRVTTTVDRNNYPGMLTGGSARLRKRWSIHFHDFSITIP